MTGMTAGELVDVTRMTAGELVDVTRMTAGELVDRDWDDSGRAGGP